MSSVTPADRDTACLTDGRPLSTPPERPSPWALYGHGDGLSWRGVHRERASSSVRLMYFWSPRPARLHGSSHAPDRLRPCGRATCSGRRREETSGASRRRRRLGRCAIQLVYRDRSNRPNRRRMPESQERAWRACITRTVRLFARRVTPRPSSRPPACTRNSTMVRHRDRCLHRTLEQLCSCHARSGVRNATSVTWSGRWQPVSPQVRIWSRQAASSLPMLHGTRPHTGHEASIIKEPNAQQRPEDGSCAALPNGSPSLVDTDARPSTVRRRVRASTNSPTNRAG